MSVSVNTPEVVALRKSVEEKFVHPLNTHNSFFALSDAVFDVLREHISESTLERLWGYSTRGVDSVSIRTLDVLARYTGAASWSDFTATLKATSPVESQEIETGGISTSEFIPGAQLLLGWMPDRLVTVEYLGGNRFMVVDSVNSKLKAGDSFCCFQFCKGRPLYMDRFRRNGREEEKSYVAGERSGLTVLERL